MSAPNKRLVSHLDGLLLEAKDVTERVGLTMRNYTQGSYTEVGFSRSLRMLASEFQDLSDELDGLADEADPGSVK